MNGNGKPPKDDHSRIYDQLRAGTVVRPDPTALPRGPQPKTIPFFFTEPGEQVPLEDRLHVRSLPDPSEPVRPLPFPLHLDPERVEGVLGWQYPFLDTLTQTIRAEPGFIEGNPYPANYTTGHFMPKGRAITLSGNIIPSKVSQSEELRWTAAHEFGHLLTHNDSAILDAFVNAAPLPKRLKEERGDLFNVVWQMGLHGKGSDTTRTPNWGREYYAGEAFSDMFADALAKRLPGMQEGAGRERMHYPFTPQFRSRNRQKMVDSLVDNLLGNLKP